jgi:DNA-binding PadR family transcriptional regulator
VLRIAILSLLADGDYSGYDLSKAFDASVTYVWAASQSQIYPELRGLSEKGLVEGVEVTQGRRPDKRVYRITPAGRAALVEWVERSPAALGIRDPFQLQVINAGRLPPERARALVAAQRALLQRRFDILAAIRDQLEARGHTPGEPYGEKLGWRLAVEAGLRTAEAYIGWCDWALTQLDASAQARPD